jgi:uncharacterized protein YdeI (YjbR/CyaY-like superfamily)
VDRGRDVETWYASKDAGADVLIALREALRRAGLEEAMRWGVPCYRHAGRNVALVSAGAPGAVLSLLSGALVADPDGWLERAGPHSRHARLLRVPDVGWLRAHQDALTGLIRRAMAVAASGARVAPPEEEPLPDALTEALEADPALAAAFAALTPGRRRAWALNVAGAKTLAGREARVARAVPRVLDGKGPHDCVCGRTQRPPRCDGSHGR